MPPHLLLDGAGRVLEPDNLGVCGAGHTWPHVPEGDAHVSGAELGHAQPVHGEGVVGAAGGPARPRPRPGPRPRRHEEGVLGADSGGDHLLGLLANAEGHLGIVSC